MRRKREGRGRTNSLVEESLWGGRERINALVGIEISKFYCSKGNAV